MKAIARVYDNSFASRVSSTVACYDYYYAFCVCLRTTKKNKPLTNHFCGNADVVLELLVVVSVCAAVAVAVVCQ